MEKYDRFVRRWADRFNYVAIAAIAAMLGVVVVDILGTKLFRTPLPGSMDIIGLLGLVAASFAIARTEVFKQHVRVDFLLVLLKERTQAMIGIVSNFIALALIALLIWRSIDYGMVMQADKTSSPTLRILSFPFGYAIAFACIPLFMVLLYELFESIRGARKK